MLDAAWPRPTDDRNGDRLTVGTMRAMAEVFSDEGYSRCIDVQTASVVDFRLVRKALGPVQMRGVLLTASVETRIARLSGREIGSDLDRHVVNGRLMANRLEMQRPSG